MLSRSPRAAPRAPRTLPRVAVLALAMSPLASVAAGAVASAPGDDLAPSAAARVPSISAEWISRHEPSGIELGRVRVDLAPEGMRLVQRGADAHLEIVHDFVGMHVRFVDHERAVVHELPLGRMSAADREAFPGVMAASTEGLFASAPCVGRTRGAARSGRWRGRPIEIVACLDEGGAPESFEAFSPEWRMVIRTSDPDGHVEELRDIRARTFAAEHFTPAPRLRAIDRQEFFHGVPALDRYAGDAAANVVPPRPALR